LASSTIQASKDMPYSKTVKNKTQKVRAGEESEKNVSARHVFFFWGVSCSTVQKRKEM